MGRMHHIENKKSRQMRVLFSICVVVLVIAIVMFVVQHYENKLNVKVENAGMQMTSHGTEEENTAQVFMNGQWYQKKDVETLLVIGIDDFGIIAGSDSYNNTHQADFLMLFVSNKENGECVAVHLNRDTMANIPMLGVTGEKAGTQYAQIALAFNYGRGQQDSSKNTVETVSTLLYGIAIDHYITVSMDAVSIMNDWAGGVMVKVLDDMTGIDGMLAPGIEINLTGEQALTYVRTRKGLDNSTNVNRMKRQQQYAVAWVDAAREKLKDQNAVNQLVVRMNDYYYSDCTIQKLTEFANILGLNSNVQIYELSGTSIQGETYMEFYADDEKLQKLVLELFYQTVN